MLKQLKGQRLGKLMRRTLWDRAKGKIYYQDGGYHLKYLPYRERNRPRDLDSRTQPLEILPPIRTKSIACNIYCLKTKYDPNQSEYTATYNALRKLEDLDLVESYSVTMYKGKQNKKWQLTNLGFAVVRAYEEEIVNQDRIRWDLDKVKRWLDIK